MFGTGTAGGTEGGRDAARGRLEWVLAQPPSAATLATLERLGQVPLGPVERVLAAQAWHRQRAAATARFLAAVADATTPTRTSPRVDTLEAEVALALCESDLAMSRTVHYAHRLRDVLPRTFSLLVEGAISERHATAMHELTAALDDGTASAVDAQVAHRAPTMTPPGFRRIVGKAVARADRRSAQERFDDARRRASGARLYPDADGMATLAVRLPATDGIAALNALNVAADRMRRRRDARSHGERQVTALLDALLGRAATGGGRLRARRRTEVSVVIDLASLTALSDEPGEVLGYGPVPAAAVRRLLGQEGTVLRRLVTDPVTGVLVDYGRSRYRPDAHLRRLVDARDVTCRYPGCTRNAVWCDVEHGLPYADGGSTSCANCGLMCRKHHRAKTHDGFRYHRPDPATGATVWTTPLGFVYQQAPARYDADGIDLGDIVRDSGEP